MKVLLVEDDEDKRTQLMSFVQERISNECDIARSYQTGLRALVSKEYELVLLDMSMTMYDIGPSQNGGRPQAYAGKEILKQMKRRGIISKVIVVTQFDKFGIGNEETTLGDLNSDLLANFSEVYLGAVHFSLTYTGWKERLLALLFKNNIKTKNV